MTKGENNREAAKSLELALMHLRQAKQCLLNAKSDQHILLAVDVASIEETLSLITDPECNPDYMED